MSFFETLGYSMLICLSIGMFGGAIWILKNVFWTYSGELEEWKYVDKVEFTFSIILFVVGIFFSLATIGFVMHWY